MKLSPPDSSLCLRLATCASRTGRRDYSRPNTLDRSTALISPPCGGARSLLRGPGRVAAPWLCTSCGSSGNIFGASNPHCAVFTRCSGGDEISFLAVLGVCVTVAACTLPAAHSVPIRIANECLMLTSEIVNLPGGTTASAPEPESINLESGFLRYVAATG